MTEELKPKGPPRAKYSDAMILKLTAGRDPESAPVVLLNACVMLNLPHATLDEALGVSLGTVMAYMKAGGDVPGLDTARVYQLLEHLAALYTAGAFTPKGLSISATLRVMLPKAEVAA